MTRKFNLKAFAIAAVVCFGLAAFAQGPSSFPPTWVWARAYGNWSLIGQQANTLTFNGAVCYNSPYNNGASAPFFDFSGTVSGSTVYFPVNIQDASASLSEVVTPTSTTNTSASCGFAASTANSHTSFTLSSGTAGLQEALASQPASGPATSVILDNYWYQLVYGLPNHATGTLPEGIIKAATGSTGVQIVDTTTSPFTYWRWNGSAYAIVAPVNGTGLGVGGTSMPTLAAGAAAGSSPTVSNKSGGDGQQFEADVTTGTATTTGTLFTETWATSNAFGYPPVCNVWSSGTNAFNTFTTAVTYPSSTHALLTVTVTATPAISTAFKFSIVCQ